MLGSSTRRLLKP